jgi:hypothetical protein|tara:strand:+ start:223 stop:741 length:519 start_codon:yes stop_codon:yes gene_type:complete
MEGVMYKYIIAILLLTALIVTTTHAQTITVNGVRAIDNSSQWVFVTWDNGTECKATDVQPWNSPNEGVKSGQDLIDHYADNSTAFFRVQSMVFADSATLDNCTGTHPYGVSDSAQDAKAKMNSSILKNLTPQQSWDYIDNNVTDLASAKVAMKWIVRYMISMKKQIKELNED